MDNKHEFGIKKKGKSQKKKEIKKKNIKNYMNMYKYIINLIIVELR